VERRPIITETVSKIERIKITKHIQREESEIKLKSHRRYKMERKPVKAQTVKEQKPIKRLQQWQTINICSIQPQRKPQPINRLQHRPTSDNDECGD
jgi:hypothetical protein